MAKAKAQPKAKSTKTAAKPKKPAAKPAPQAPKPAPKPKPAIELAPEEEIILVTGSELLDLINGFEGEVAQLKHLQLKVAANDGNRVLNKQLASQKRIVNAFIGSLKVKV